VLYKKKHSNKQIEMKKEKLSILGGSPNPQTMLEKPIQESIDYLTLLVTSKKKEMMQYIPFEAKSMISNMLNTDPKKRADHDRLLNGNYFKDPQSKVTEFIELFFSKTEQQQKEFLCLIGKALIRKGDNQG
jgi:serine/threonine protein kinase